MGVSNTYLKIKDPDLPPLYLEARKSFKTSSSVDKCVSC